MSHMTDMIRRQMGAKYSRIFSDFFNHLDSSFDASFRPKIQANSQLMKNTINSTPIYNSRRLASYSSMEKSTHNEKDFVEMAKFVFGEGDWDKDYGGPSWEQACDAWLQLYNSKSEDSDIIAIDHMYDIEHNTGNILDKSNHFLKNGQFTWLSNALNKKARITSPMQIIDDISPAMTQIALPAIKLKYGQTLEDKMKADTFKTQIPGAGFDDLIKKEFDENQGIYDAGIPELKMARTLRGILAAYKVRRIDFRIIELAKSKIRVPLDSQKIKQFFQQEYQNCRNIETGNFGHVKVLMTKDLIYEIQKNLEDPYGHRSGIKDRIAGETNYDDEVIKSLVDYCEKLVEDGGNVSSILAVR
jgi:hypothetical protein